MLHPPNLWSVLCSRLSLCDCLRAHMSDGNVENFAHKVNKEGVVDLETLEECLVCLLFLSPCIMRRHCP